MRAIDADERPKLQIASATWDREDEAKRQGLVLDAAHLGFRLVVVREDGVEWAPDPATAERSDRISTA